MTTLYSTNIAPDDQPQRIIDASCATKKTSSTTVKTTATGAKSAGATSADKSGPAGGPSTRSRTRSTPANQTHLLGGATPATTKPAWTSEHADWPLRLALFALIAGLFVYGCKNLDPHSRPQDDTRDAARAIGKIPERTEAIDEHAKAIEKRTPKKSLIDIVRDVEAIHFQAGAIREDVSDGLVKLKDADAKIEGLQATLGATEKDRDKWKAEATSWQRKAGGTFVTFGMVLLAAGVFAAMYGQKWGKPLSACALVLVIGGVVLAYFAYWIGLAAMAVAAAILIPYLWRKMHVEVKATSELVSTLEVAKQVMPAVERKAIVGDGALRGQADIIQSKSTRKLVKVVRGKQKEVGKIRLAKTEESPIAMKVEE